MNIRNAISISMTVLLLAGCSSVKYSRASVSTTKRPEKTKEATVSPETSASPVTLSTDRTKLADKTLSIDYDFLEKIPLDGSKAKEYVNNSDYAKSLNSEYFSPDPDGFEVTVRDRNYHWLQENYTFNSKTENPYLNLSKGNMTVSISGEAEHENSDGYYPDTVDALKKNLTNEGYQSAGDHPGSQDESGYQVNYYNYSKGERMFSISEVVLNGEFSTCVIEVGDPA